MLTTVKQETYTKHQSWTNYIRIYLSFWRAIHDRKGSQFTTDKKMSRFMTEKKISQTGNFNIVSLD